MALSEWFADREVLITGVTSELGRNLLEKILRSFPTTHVHVVIRSRFNLSNVDRVKKMFQSPGYERLDPTAFSRVHVVEGNLLYPDLGMSKTDKASMSKVSVVFHAAGPHDDTFQFGEELPNLKVLVAASSIFKHKGQITEALQNERVPQIPLALVRLPFLGPAYEEPMPGFVELLKGPTALIAGAGFAFGNSELAAEVTPIDVATNTLIASAWETGTGGANEAVVYNAVTIGCTWDDLIKNGARYRRKFAYPTFGIRGMTAVVPLYWIIVTLLEWLPSFLCDTLIGMCGGKQRILVEYDRVRNALRSLESISSRPWLAERNRVYQLQKHLTPKDQEAFPVAPSIDVESYVVCAAAATRKYCVDETNLTIVKILRLPLLAVALLLLGYGLFLGYRAL